jgi:hypothetical protein
VRGVALGALAFAGAGQALIGLAGVAVASGLVAGHERVALGVVEALAAACAIAIGLGSTRGTGLGRVGEIAGVWAAGALVLVGSVWGIDLAIVRPLDPPEGVVAGALVALGLAVAVGSLHQQRARPDGATTARALRRVAPADGEDELVPRGQRGERDP